MEDQGVVRTEGLSEKRSDGVLGMGWKEAPLKRTRGGVVAAACRVKEVAVVQNNINSQKQYFGMEK